MIAWPSSHHGEPGAVHIDRFALLERPRQTHDVLSAFQDFTIQLLQPANQLGREVHFSISVKTQHSTILPVRRRGLWVDLFRRPKNTRYSQIEKRLKTARKVDLDGRSAKDLNSSTTAPSPI